MTIQDAINYFKGSMAIGEDDAIRHHNEVLEFTIKTLEQEPCEDTVSREAVKELFQEGSVMGMYYFLGIDKLPSVTHTRKTGKWINIDATHSKCDRCGAVFEIASENGEVNYCPHCGSRMDEEVEEKKE